MLDDTGYRTLNADTYGSMVPKRWKSVACAASIVAIIAVAAAIALTIDDLKQRDKLHDASSNSMTTPAEALRRSTSDIMKANMNFAADPCEDFYEYSCGGWLNRTTIPADKKQIYFVMGDIDKYNQDVLKGILTSDFQWEPITPYYNLCMNRTAANATGMKPLASYLEQIAALTQGESYYSDLMKLLAQLHLVNANAFFAYSSGADLYTPTLNVGQLQQGGFQLPGKVKYFPNMSDPNVTNHLVNYTIHINNMLTFLGVDSPVAGAEIVALETQLANISMSTVDQRDINGTYHLVNLTGVFNVSSLPWSVYLEALGVPAEDLSKPQEYPINVVSLDFIKGMDKLIRGTPVSTVQSYLRWTLIHANAAYLTDAVETENFNFFGKELTGVTVQKNRTDKCIGMVDSMLGQILGKYYIREAFTESAKNLTIAMMKSVIDAMYTKLEHVEFMNSSPETRAKAIEKLSKFKEQIGYPNVWKSYDKLKLDHSSYFTDSAAITQFLNREIVQSVNHPVDRNAWGMTTPTVNAYYDPPTNQIVIPAGILQGLYFNELFHPAINYGGTGGTQGHEMTHGFDDQGAQYDGDGKFVNWWAPQVLKVWNEQTACLSDFYSQYLVLDEPNFKLHLDGNLTNGENIADVGGLKQAFHAYQSFVNVTKSVDGIDTSKPYFDWLSNDQLFFVSYAQGWCEKSTRQATIDFQSENPHAPGKFRVNGPVTQNRDFARVFGCTIGKNTMAPTKICDIW